jgi:hypothetical protein
MHQVLIVEDQKKKQDYLANVVSKWDDKLQPIVTSQELESLPNSLAIAIVSNPLIVKRLRQQFPNCFIIFIGEKGKNEDYEELSDYFVSFDYSNRDFRSQIEDAISIARKVNG